jgi:PKD repeat protein
VDSSTQTATFSPASLNPDNLYRWEFGDGSVEMAPKVVKSFPKPGYYTATLKVSNPKNGCLQTRTETILIGRKSTGGKAGFIYVSGNGTNVQFNDRSLGDELKYFWNFGDDNISSLQNPLHEYALPGYYFVCLTVATPDGNRNMYCEKIFAGENTKDECLARFEYRLSEDQRRIYCLDRSLGNPNQWKWTYDDGWSTTAQNPSWSISTPDYLKLQQTIRNSTSGCRDDAVALINMGAEGALKAGFGYVIDTSNTKADTYPVDFIGVSLGDAGKLKWSFGDGTYDSTTINPVHVYAQPGIYEVCLTVTNTTTGERDESCELVRVGIDVSSREIETVTGSLRSYPNPFRETTRIEFSLEHRTPIVLAVYDLMGRKVKTLISDVRTAGVHHFELNASSLDAGQYYLILKTSHQETRSILSIVK